MSTTTSSSIFSGSSLTREGPGWGDISTSGETTWGDVTLSGSVLPERHTWSKGKTIFVSHFTFFGVDFHQENHSSNEHANSEENQLEHNVIKY